MRKLDLNSPSFLQALFQGIPELLPEFRFQLSGSREVYTSQDAPSGLVKKAEDKKKYFVGSNTPKTIRCHKTSRDTIGVIDYIKERERLSGFYSTLKYVCEAINFPMPESSPEEQKRYEEALKKESTLNKLAQHFRDTLHSTEGKNSDTWEYLTQERGYTEEEIEAMGLGMYAGEKLSVFIAKEGIDKKDAEQYFSEYVIRNQQHTVVIPYYSGGKLHGFQMRTDRDAEGIPKYQYSPKMKKGELLFNSPSMFTGKGKSFVCITEGELDTLSLQHKFFNIGGNRNREGEEIYYSVATGGNSLTEEQIMLLKKLKARRIYLCYDFDANKEEETNKTRLKVMKSLLSHGFYDIGIIDLTPSESESYEKRDIDSILKEGMERGAKKFAELFGKQQTYYEYFLANIQRRYKQKTTEEAFSLLTLHSIEEEILSLWEYITDSLHREQYKKLALKFLRSLPSQENYSDASFSEALEKQTEKYKEEKKAESLQKANKEAETKLKAGDTEGAELTFINAVKSLEKAEQINYSQLLTPFSKEDFLRAKLKRGEGTGFGLFMGEEEILLPTGALTIVSAPTGHGKTAFKLNIVRELLQKTSKKVVFFTYEEPSDRILSYLLNTFIAKPISVNNRKSIEYFYHAEAQKSSLFSGTPEVTESTKMILTEDREYFVNTEGSFWSRYVNTGKVRVISEQYKVENLVKAIETLKTQDNSIEFIFIDYIQLLYLETKNRNGTRQEELKIICDMLKDCAIRTGLSIVLSAQYNRDVMSIPHMTEKRIREAGDIEHIASMILGLWNIKAKAIADKDHAKEHIRLCNQARNDYSIQTGIYCVIHKSRQLPSGAQVVIPYEEKSQNMNFAGAKKLE